MAVETLAEHIRDELGERVLGTDVAYDQLTVTVDPAYFPQVARFCKNDLGMTFFDFLSGVDEREEGFSVVARVYNHVKRESVLLKTMVPGGREEPKVPTLTGVYAGANWHERETYDMFGILFEGHPGLLPRILTVENFEGWPLRKEFKLASRVVKPWPGAKEPTDSSDDDEKKDSKPEPAAAEPEDRAAAAKAKAERAKKKAAAARKRKAEERAAAEAAENPTGSEGADSQPQPDGTAAEADDGSAITDDAEPGSAREAADAAAGAETPAHTPDPTTPEGAAKIADTAVAKDAAAGTTSGEDVATGEQPDSGEPKVDEEREAAAAEGGPASPGGTPGVEAEGTHDLDDSTARPSGDEAVDAQASDTSDGDDADPVPAADTTRPTTEGDPSADDGDQSAEDDVT
ncbi:NADH-quinone oxidoreductase subunit C [Euzebya tangerina]|uniref:NADH-quinone oxidoreductase subunit C n=1 Tax=Euzebya tangerina TaxID=591198 RepID=UPI000E3189CD|nr:NADH-quinone oxidoreductase subunit C [Euzebya tangerina]